MPASADHCLLLDAAGMAIAIDRLAAEICADAAAVGAQSLALIGVHNRGVPLAQRIAAAMKDRPCADLQIGTIDVTQYRDDLNQLVVLPQLIGSDIPFDVNEAFVVLCDEVLYTGRTIRAALDELLDHGRPHWVRLAVLVERVGREFPIQPDFVGLHAAATPDQRVRVRFTEVDDRDAVFIEPSPSSLPS
jgi:pyrimidine operon attenuation protein / uracil phosphoribosyltransferase